MATLRYGKKKLTAEQVLEIVRQLSEEYSHDTTMSTKQFNFLINDRIIRKYGVNIDRL